MKDLAERFSVQVVNHQTGEVERLTADMDVPTAGAFYPALRAMADRARQILIREFDARRGDLPRIEAHIGGFWYEYAQETYPEYDAGALHKSLSALAKVDTSITQDEIDEAIPTIVTYKANGTKLNALKKRGRAVAGLIEMHCVRKPKAPSFGLKR